MTDSKFPGNIQESVTVVGGGLAGCEAALQLARRGVYVRLIERKPRSFSPAHKNPDLAELVCSNSFRARDPLNAVGCLKEEMSKMGSAFMAAAIRTEVPAGGALAVHREEFSALLTRWIEQEEGIELIREEATKLPAEPAIVASGPLTSDVLAEEIGRSTGADGLHFYDAIAPVIDADSIDMNHAFFASRYDKGGDDYLNLPLNEDEYHAFIKAVVASRKVPPRPFEKPKYFEGCMPIDVLAERGPKTLAFGMMKPVGLIDPKTGRRPFAVVQLRAENAQRSAYNMVGFQTRMSYDAQKQVFRMIPALANARFLRLGSVHRNSFIDAPRLLDDTLRLRSMPNLRFAGQITGVEGYVESAFCGLMAAFYTLEEQLQIPFSTPPEETLSGGLLRHLTTPRDPFQPSNVTHAMLPPPEKRLRKTDRKRFYRDRAREAFERWWPTTGLRPLAFED